MPPNSRSWTLLLSTMSAKQTRVKKRVFRRMKVKLKAAVCWFSEWHQRSKGGSHCLSDLFWKYCENSPFNSVAHRWRHENLTPVATQTNKPFYGLLLWERRMEQRRTKTLPRDTQRLILHSMASPAQNVGENPRHVPWNNKNTEFEGRRQNTMSCSCIYEGCLWQRKILLYPTFRCITHKKVSKVS